MRPTTDFPVPRHEELIRDGKKIAGGMERHRIIEGGVPRQRVVATPGKESRLMSSADLSTVRDADY